MDILRLCHLPQSTMLLLRIRYFLLKIKLRLQNLLFKNTIYYINGSETLPPPLSAEEEERMISIIDSDEAKSKLIEHNLRLVAYIAKRFENTGANIEELIFGKLIMTFGVPANN